MSIKSSFSGPTGVHHFEDIPITSVEKEGENQALEDLLLEHIVKARKMSNTHFCEILKQEKDIKAHKDKKSRPT